VVNPGRGWPVGWRRPWSVGGGDPRDVAGAVVQQEGGRVRSRPTGERWWPTRWCWPPTPGPHLSPGSANKVVALSHLRAASPSRSPEHGRRVGWGPRQGNAEDNAPTSRPLLPQAGPRRADPVGGARRDHPPQLPCARNPPVYDRQQRWVAGRWPTRSGARSPQLSAVRFTHHWGGPSASPGSSSAPRRVRSGARITNGFGYNARRGADPHRRSIPPSGRCARRARCKRHCASWTATSRRSQGPTRCSG